MGEATVAPDPLAAAPHITIVGPDGTSRYVTENAYTSVLDERDDLRRTLALVNVAWRIGRASGITTPLGDLLDKAGFTLDFARSTASVLRGVALRTTTTKAMSSMGEQQMNSTARDAAADKLRTSHSNGQGCDGPADSPGVCSHRFRPTPMTADEVATDAADPAEPIKRAIRTLLPGLEVANYAERWAAGSPAVQALTILTEYVGGADVVAGDLQDPHVPTAHPRRPAAEPPTVVAQTSGDDVEAVSAPPRDDEFAPGMRTTATGTVVPYVTDQAKQFLAESTSLNEELFDLADLFRVPVTNNVARFEDNDPSRPVYHVGEFIAAITTAVARHQPTRGADAGSLPEGGEQRG